MRRVVFVMPEGERSRNHIALVAMKVNAAQRQLLRDLDDIGRVDGSPPPVGNAYMSHLQHVMGKLKENVQKSSSEVCGVSRKISPTQDHADSPHTHHSAAELPETRRLAKELDRALARHTGEIEGDLKSLGSITINVARNKSVAQHREAKARHLDGKHRLHGLRAKSQKEESEELERMHNMLKQMEHKLEEHIKTCTRLKRAHTLRPQTTERIDGNEKGIQTLRNHTLVAVRELRAANTQIQKDIDSHKVMLNEHAEQLRMRERDELSKNERSQLLAEVSRISGVQTALDDLLKQHTQRLEAQENSLIAMDNRLDQLQQMQREMAVTAQRKDEQDHRQTQTQIRDLESRIDRLSKQVKLDQEASLVKIKQMTDLNAGQAEAIRASLKQDMDHLTDSISRLIERVDESDSQRDVFNTELVGIRTLVNELHSKVEDVEKTSAEVDTSLSRAIELASVTNNDQLNGAIAKLNEEHAANAANFERLIEDRNAQIDALLNNANSSQSKITTIEQKLNRIVADYEDYAKKLANMKGEIDNICTKCNDAVGFEIRRDSLIAQSDKIEAKINQYDDETKSRIFTEVGYDILTHLSATKRQVQQEFDKIRDMQLGIDVIDPITGQLKNELIQTQISQSGTTMLNLLWDYERYLNDLSSALEGYGGSTQRSRVQSERAQPIKHRAPLPFKVTNSRVMEESLNRELSLINAALLDENPSNTDHQSIRNREQAKYQENEPLRCPAGYAVCPFTKQLDEKSVFVTQKLCIPQGDGRPACEPQFQDENKNYKQNFQAYNDRLNAFYNDHEDVLKFSAVVPSRLYKGVELLEGRAQQR